MPLTLEHLHSLGAERPNDYLKFDENPDSINQTLQWMKDLSSADFTFAVGEKRINEQFKIMNAQLKGLAATASKNISIQKNFYFSQAVGYLFKNLRKGLNNLLQGRKKRKWLTILGSMGLGAGVGAIIGTMVFPLLGTAVGGALGSAIGGISAAVAGPIGLSFLGGAFGTWLGRKFAKKFAPSKSVYNISEKAKSSLKLMLNLEEDELVKLHAYLINRANSVKDPTLKKALRLLDNTIFKNKAPTGVVRLTDFLKSELAELEQLDAPNSQHEADKQFIQKILAKLPNHLNPLQSQTALQDKNIQSDNDSKQPNANLVQDKKLKSGIESKKLNTNTIQDKNTQSEIEVKQANANVIKDKSAHAIPLRVSQNTQNTETTNRPDLLRLSQHSTDMESGIILQTLRSLDQKEFQQFENNFQEHVMGVFQFKGIRKNTVIGEESPGHRKIQYLCEHKNANVPPLEIMFHETQQEHGVEVEMYTKTSSDQDIQVVAKVIALQMKIYREQSLKSNKQSEVIVVANGNKNIAIALLTAAYKEGLSPSLDSFEFPNEKERNEIINFAKKDATTTHKFFGLKLK